MLPPAAATSRRREDPMRIAIVCAAFASSLLAFIAMLGTGLFLAAVEQSGARGAGLLLGLAGIIAFGSALFLILAPAAYFRDPRRKTIGMAATLAAAMPVAVFGWAAFLFSGLPIASRSPLIDWMAFGSGVVLALGAMCILALGFLRVRGRPEARPPPPGARLPPEDPYDMDDDVKVTRV